MPAIEAIPVIDVASSESAATDPASSRFRLKWFAFRAVFVFALLQWLPLAYLLTAGSLTFGAWSPPRVWGPVTNAFGHWALTAILRLPEHSPQTYMSANDLPLFLGMVVEAILAFGAALLWTVFKPRTSNPRLFASLYLANRYMLAGSIFYYAWGKVLLLQFAPSLDYFAFEVAQHNPRDLLWAFMTGSSSYQFFAGVIEVTAALMLLSRRTVIAGALLSLAAMSNVLALDLGYDVSVKFIALEMFLMALFAVVPYWAVLAAVLLRHVTPRADAWPQTIVLHKFSRGARIVALIVGIWLVTATLYDTVRLRARVLEDRRTPLSGIWDVEQITRDGTDVPPHNYESRIVATLRIPIQKCGCRVSDEQLPTSASW